MKNLFHLELDPPGTTAIWLWLYLKSYFSLEPSCWDPFSLKWSHAWNISLKVLIWLTSFFPRCRICVGNDNSHGALLSQFHRHSDATAWWQERQAARWALFPWTNNKSLKVGCLCVKVRAGRNFPASLGRPFLTLTTPYQKRKKKKKKKTRIRTSQEKFSMTENVFPSLQ